MSYIDDKTTIKWMFIAFLVVFNLFYSFWVISMKGSFLVQLPIILFLHLVALSIAKLRKRDIVFFGLIYIVYYYFMSFGSSTTALMNMIKNNVLFPHLASLFFGVLLGELFSRTKLRSGILCITIYFLTQILIAMMIPSLYALAAIVPIILYLISILLLNRKNETLNINFYYSFIIALYIILSSMGDIGSNIILPLLSGIAIAYLVYLFMSDNIVKNTILISFISTGLYLFSINYEHYHYNTSKKLSSTFQIYSEDSLQYLIDLPGEVKVVDVWHRFCAPCIRRMPKYGRLSAKYKNNSRIKFYTLGIPLKDSTHMITKDLYERLDIDIADIYAPTKDLADSLDVKFYPTILVIDKGTIIYNGKFNTMEYNYYNLNQILEMYTTQRK